MHMICSSKYAFPSVTVHPNHDLLSSPNRRRSFDGRCRRHRSGNSDLRGHSSHYPRRVLRQAQADQDQGRRGIQTTVSIYM